MSDVLLSFRGRQIRGADVTFLREFISQNPSLSRRRLSVKVCQAWNWVQPNGQPRDMVCRGLMLALHRVASASVRRRENLGGQGCRRGSRMKLAGFAGGPDTHG